VVFGPKRHNRRSIRLCGYDYAQAGAYFVTIVTQGRECLFGQVVGGEMRLNDAGRMMWDEWKALGQRFPSVELDEFVVMPNHIHGIVRIVEASVVDAHDGATTRGATTRDAPTSDAHDGAITNGATTRDAPTLGDIVGAFKSITTNEYIRGVKTLGWISFPGRLWQRNYYEHIVRDGASLDRILR
jgi:REP element-mobilizing transposase RayT